MGQYGLTYTTGSSTVHLIMLTQHCNKFFPSFINQTSQFELHLYSTRRKYHMHILYLIKIGMVAESLTALTALYAILGSSPMLE